MKVFCSFFLPPPPCSPNHPHHPTSFASTTMRCLYLQSVPFALYTNPQCTVPSLHTPDFVFVKGSVSNVLCRRNSCHCATPFFQASNKRGQFFLSFFSFWQGGSVHFCVQVLPPLTPALFWSSYSLCVLTRNRNGGKGGHLIWLLCKPEGQPQHSWPLQTQPQTNTTTATPGLSDGQLMPSVIAISVYILATVGSMCQHYTPLISEFSMTVQSEILSSSPAYASNHTQHTHNTHRNASHLLPHSEFSGVYTAEMSGISGD